MPARPAPFRVTDVKRALKAAHDFGMTVTGYEIGADGSIVVRTSEAPSNSADAALETWKRGQHGKRRD